MGKHWGYIMGMLGWCPQTLAKLVQINGFIGGMGEHNQLTWLRGSHHLAHHWGNDGGNDGFCWGLFLGTADGSTCCYICILNMYEWGINGLVLKYIPPKTWCWRIFMGFKHEQRTQTLPINPHKRSGFHRDIMTIRGPGIQCFRLTNLRPKHWGRWTGSPIRHG